MADASRMTPDHRMTTRPRTSDLWPPTLRSHACGPPLGLAPVVPGARWPRGPPRGGPGGVRPRPPRGQTKMQKYNDSQRLSSSTRDGCDVRPRCPTNCPTPKETTRAARTRPSQRTHLTSHKSVPSQAHHKSPCPARKTRHPLLRTMQTAARKMCHQHWHLVNTRIECTCAWHSPRLEM